MAMAGGEGVRGRRARSEAARRYERKCGSHGEFMWGRINVHMDKTVTATYACHNHTAGRNVSRWRWHARPPEPEYGCVCRAQPQVRAFETGR